MHCEGLKGFKQVKNDYSFKKNHAKKFPIADFIYYVYGQDHRDVCNIVTVLFFCVGCQKKI